MRWRALFRLIRPVQWVKNSFIFAAIVFAKRFADPTAQREVVETFVAFCLLASSVYVFNDLLDRHRDRNHPLKKDRPIASGVIAPGVASVLALLLAVGGLALTSLVNPHVVVAGVVYLALNVAYTLVLKHIVLLDVFAVTGNYVIRVIAGAEAISVPVTPWLLIASTLLALFLSLGKRRYELALLGEEAGSHRKSLGEYSAYLLDQLIGIVTASLLVVYSFYTLAPETEARLGTDKLPLTIPFVLYGIFRYLYLIHKREQGGNPTETLLSDPPLIITVLLWVLTALFLIHD